MLTEMTNVVGAASWASPWAARAVTTTSSIRSARRDYYRMQAFFATTHDKDIPLANDGGTSGVEAEIGRRLEGIECPAGEKLKAAIGPEHSQDRTNRRREGKERSRAPAGADRPLPRPMPRIHAVHVLDTRRARTLPGRKDGHAAAGCAAARRLARSWAIRPTSLASTLAKWITDPANPLTARVMVNRIWQGHFGAGIVATPNDFGRMGTRPRILNCSTGSRTSLSKAAFE